MSFLRLDDYEYEIDGSGNFITSSGSRSSSNNYLDISSSSGPRSSANYLDVSSSSRTRSSNRSRSSSPRHFAGERPDSNTRSSRSILRSEDAGTVGYISRSPSPRPRQFAVVPAGVSLVTVSSDCDYEKVGVKEMVFSEKIVYDKDGKRISSTSKQEIRYGQPSSSSRNTMEYIQERAVPALPLAASTSRSKNY